MGPPCRRNYMASCTTNYENSPQFLSSTHFSRFVRCCAVDWLTLWDRLSRPQTAGKTRVPNSSDANTSRWPTSPSCWSAKFASDGLKISQIPMVNHGSFSWYFVKISAFPYVKTPSMSCGSTTAMQNVERHLWGAKSWMEISDDPIGPVSGRSHEENEGKRPTSHREQTCILTRCFSRGWAETNVPRCVGSSIIPWKMSSFKVACLKNTWSI